MLLESVLNWHLYMLLAAAEITCKVERPSASVLISVFFLGLVSLALFLYFECIQVPLK